MTDNQKMKQRPHILRKVYSDGFSMVEMLLYLGLLSILLLVLTNFFVSILDVQSRALSATSLQENSKYISARIKYDLRRADMATNSAALGTPTSSVSFVKDVVTYTYAVSDGVLELASPSATLQLHDDDVSVSNFQVTRIGNEQSANELGTGTFNIEYELSTAQQVGGDVDTRSYSFTVGMR